MCYFSIKEEDIEMNEKKYMPRLIDKRIEDYLSVLGAVSIEGPKWCGKTLTSLNHAKSVTYMDDDDNKDLARIDVKSIFVKELDRRPQLIDQFGMLLDVNVIILFLRGILF